MSFAAFKPVLLLTDGLMFFLLLLVFVVIWQVLKKPLMRARWRQVFATNTGMLTAVIILFYASIAVLDSMHFRLALEQTNDNTTSVHYSQEVLSVLDLVLSDLKNHNETTYSKPFALYSAAKKNMQDEQGQTYRDYPRLKYGGQHLEKEEDKLADIVYLTLKALLITALVGLFAYLLFRFIARKQKEPREIKKAALPWTLAFICLGVLLFISCWILVVGAYYHILGTDKVGEDVLYQSIKAIRTGVLIGTLATFLTLPIAIVLGVCAGYFKGWVDDVVQYTYTTLSSIPGILLIAASVLLTDVYLQLNPEMFSLGRERADFKFLFLCLILGVTSWTGLCRLLRAETLKISELDYVQAAHAFGVSHSGIIRRHILPNITHLILIALVLDFSSFVLAESILSYIGVGVDSSMHSWGNMINSARGELSREPVVWWPLAAAFMFMLVLVLAVNLFADRVRDAFDPKF